jgi:hypothetical protein
MGKGFESRRQIFLTFLLLLDRHRLTRDIDQDHIEDIDITDTKIQGTRLVGGGVM